MRKRRRVLYVLHNHPARRPGGAEVYALELHTAMNESSEFEPVLLAHAETRVPRMTPFGTVGGDDPRQFLLHTENGHFDHFLGTSRDKAVHKRHFRRFLEAVRPDVVHFQHTLFLGYDTIREVKETIPAAPIVYTLHDFLPICHRNGQMVRTRADELCVAASPRRCHECFPDISPTSFAQRERFIKAHFELVDLFIAPSEFLRQRYIEWGLPPEKILFEDYGRLFPADRRDDPADRPRTRLGFFGQMTRFKGLDVLLEAMKLLIEQRVRVELRVHGANLELAGHSYRRRIEALLAQTSGAVTVLGPYERPTVAGLMAGVDWVVVPSIWWENSPLVIQEAFMYGRPVLCSDIGGMAEKVRHGGDGLHFRVGDPVSLAETIKTVVGSAGLWDRLQSGIRPPHAMGDHIVTLEETYGALLAAEPGRPEREPVFTGRGRDAEDPRLGGPPAATPLGRQ